MGRMTATSNRIGALLLGAALQACSADSSPLPNEQYDAIAVPLGTQVGGRLGHARAMADVLAYIVDGTRPEDEVPEPFPEYGQPRGEWLAGLHLDSSTGCPPASWRRSPAPAPCSLVVRRRGELDLPALHAVLFDSLDGTFTFDEEQPIAVAAQATSTLLDIEYEAPRTDPSRTEHLEVEATYDFLFDPGGQHVAAGTADLVVAGRALDGSSAFDAVAELTITDGETARLVIDGDRRYVIRLSDGAVTRD